MKFHRMFLAAALAAFTLNAAPAWIQKSNEHAKLVLNSMAKFAPEMAGRMGVEGLDEQISDFSEGARERALFSMREVEAELRRRLAAETDPNVRQDLEIMLRATRENIRSRELADKHLLPYPQVAQMVFGALRSLLDDQVSVSRRPAALVRLKKYAGLAEGCQPLAGLAEKRIRSRLARSGLLGPVRAEVEQDLANSSFFLNGIGRLFDKYGIDGYQEPLERLKQQITAYNDFVRKEVLPRSRTDFRLPPELYAHNLEEAGVDIAPGELARMARKAFVELQAEMENVAAVVNKERGWKLNGYRAVIRELKKEQLVGEAILPHYRERLRQIEEIVRRENIVTLPKREARIRLASAAESAAQPAPNMQPPRLIGNTGEMGEFVLPLNAPDASGKLQQYDDFTFAAASWTLTAHEARPGHEMQFAALVENGVSTARATFAFNSTNVEGWGLYAEAVMLPYMPPEGQLVSLQFRLLRAARAFLDPELQMGKITPEEADRVLTQDVVTSPAMARQEVERYTFRMPGQAPAYFYGYTRWMEIRREAEKSLGKRFKISAFHDFMLAQGLLPPNLLRRAVLEDFVRMSAKSAN